MKKLIVILVVLGLVNVAGAAFVYLKETQPVRSFPTRTCCKLPRVLPPHPATSRTKGARHCHLDRWRRELCASR